MTEVEGIIGKLDADCATAPCSFTEDIKTAELAIIEANWTSLHTTKTADAVNSVLVAAFYAFGETNSFSFVLEHIYK